MALDPDHVEVMIDDEDSVLRLLLTESGFRAQPESGASAWMRAADRPEIAPLADGRLLTSRVDLGGQPHHFVERNGVDVERRETAMTTSVFVQSNAES